MKDTGLYKCVDEMGRIVIPREIRRSFDLEPNTPVEFYVDGKNLILKKKPNKCVFCQSTENLYLHCDVMVCGHCIDELKKIVK